jgi:hypothetical protein
MKYRIEFCALLLAIGVAAQADALNKEHISPDAKWLVHIDCDNLRQSQIGAFLLTNVLAPKVAEATGELKFNVTNLLQRISSITAYGRDFMAGPGATGVLLINSDSETQKALEGLLVAQILANTNGPVKKLEDHEPPLYSFANQVFISPQKGGPIVISKSEAQIDATRELLAGKGPSLASTKTFGDFPVVANSFFFLGVADALSLPNSIPAQAKVLQMANGGRVALGEHGDQVFLDLALRGKTAEVSREIQQVIEGMVALVSLGQPDNPDLMDLAKSTKVSCVDQLITISLEYPTGKVLARLNQEMTPKPRKDATPHHKAKSKAKAKQRDTESNKPDVKPEADGDDK